MYKIISSAISIIILFSPFLTSGSTSYSQTILVTGFEPFASYDVNPSALVAETLNGSIINGSRIIGIVLPVDFNESKSIAIEWIQKIKPSMVISLGLSPKAEDVEIEVFAFNLRWDPSSDKPLSSFKPIIPGASIIEKTNINPFYTYSQIKKIGIPVSISFSAGFYVCNSLFYNLLWYKNSNNLSMKIDFIHLPMINNLTLDDLIEAVSIAIRSNLY